jgi:predicted transposase YdaD
MGEIRGKMEGKEEGKMEAKKASVLKMHNKNLSAEAIADFIDLSIDDIKAIIAEN